MVLFNIEVYDFDDRDIYFWKKWDKNVWKIIETRNEYVDFQTLTIQEHPDNIGPGLTPSTIEVFVVKNYIDIVRPGDVIDVTGVFTVNKHKLMIINNCVVGKKVIFWNNIELKKRKISKTLQKPDSTEWIFDQLSKNIFPSIFGHDSIKKVLILSLVGGNSIHLDKMKIRSNINILLIGDPGTGKSQFLRWLKNFETSSVLTSGKGTTKAGLTAGLFKDSNEQWQLEGGALNLADNSLCLIDEFDKMDDTDKNWIHEAMEQQTISIAKWGKIITLNARWALIAAANFKYPEKGAMMILKTNFDKALLSRFDFIFEVKDRTDKILDFNIAKFVLNSHKKCQEKVNYLFFEEREMWKSYIEKAKHIKVRMTKEVETKLQLFYLNLRSVRIDIGPRQLESLIRATEAITKLNLKTETNEDHLDQVLKLFTESIVSMEESQKRKEEIYKKLVIDF